MGADDGEEGEEEGEEESEGGGVGLPVPTTANGDAVSGQEDEDDDDERPPGELVRAHPKRSPRACAATAAACPSNCIRIVRFDRPRRLPLANPQYVGCLREQALREGGSSERAEGGNGEPAAASLSTAAVQPVAPHDVASNGAPLAATDDAASATIEAPASDASAGGDAADADAATHGAVAPASNGDAVSDAAAAVLTWPEFRVAFRGGSYFHLSSSSLPKAVAHKTLVSACKSMSVDETEILPSKADYRKGVEFKNGWSVLFLKNIAGQFAIDVMNFVDIMPTLLAADGKEGFHLVKAFPGSLGGKVVVLCSPAAKAKLLQLVDRVTRAHTPSSLRTSAHPVHRAPKQADSALSRCGRRMTNSSKPSANIRHPRSKASARTVFAGCAQPTSPRSRSPIPTRTKGNRLLGARSGSFTTRSPRRHRRTRHVRRSTPLWRR